MNKYIFPLFAATLLVSAIAFNNLSSMSPQQPHSKKNPITTIHVVSETLKTLNPQKIINAIYSGDIDGVKKELDHYPQPLSDQPSDDQIIYQQMVSLAVARHGGTPLCAKFLELFGQAGLNLDFEEPRFEKTHLALALLHIWAESTHAKPETWDSLYATAHVLMQYGANPLLPFKLNPEDETGYQTVLDFLKQRTINAAHPRPPTYTLKQQKVINLVQAHVRNQAAKRTLAFWKNLNAGKQLFIIPQTFKYFPDLEVDKQSNMYLTLDTVD